MQYSLFTIGYSWLYCPIERESSMITDYILLQEIRYLNLLILREETSHLTFGCNKDREY